MTAPRIAAVVVAWNRAELLRETLGALAQQSRPLDDIIVVDNASTDDTPQAIQGSEAVTDTVTLPSNFGGAGGFAAGIARAVSRGADFV
ncbi:UNVERIFIED_CONTAM: glycosyltransferase, partial [Bacillus sp. ATCC 13368]